LKASKGVKMKKTYLMVIMVLVLLLSQTAESATVNIDLNTTHQTIRGFGGMNFPRWIGTLTNAQVDTAFGNGSGQIGLTIMRIDVPYDSNNWSGELSAAQRAINNHGAIVLASPWSPPPSMKTNNDYRQGELKTDSYDDFANYLTDFANYMSSNGAPLFAVSVQNEPDWLPDYESCGWSASQMQTFLNNNASVIPTRVIAPECVHYKEDYVSAVASSPECNIVAVHAYGGTITYYPDKEYWMTEHYTDSSTNANVWPNALGVGEEIHDCMTANMSGYIWWYIRRSYGPMDESGNITKRGYCMSHFAKFARPGYIRVDATANPSSGVYVTAYKSDSNLVIVAVNQNSTSSDVTFSLSGGIVSSYTKYETTSDSNLSNMGSVGSTNTLAAYSINTFVAFYITGPQQTLTCSSTTGGSVTTPGEGDFQFGQDTYANIVATADLYYHFAYWTGTAVEEGKIGDVNDSSTTVLMDANYTVIANFEENPPDYNPPDPDPMTWAVVPTATGPSSITMTASTASDISGVEYSFECVTGGGHNSGWQDSTAYTDTGLTPSTTYTYRVQARDKSLNQNVTGWSSSLAATTTAQPTEVNIIGSWATGTTHAKENGNNRALIFIAHGEVNAIDMNLVSVTYGGQAMTKIIDINVGSGTGYRDYVGAFILKEAGINAASGSAFVPSWNITPESNSFASAFFSSVDQTTPIGATARNGTATSSPNPITTAVLATSNGDMVALGATCGNNGSYTLNNSFTEGTDQSVGSAGHTGVTGYKRATGVAETPSATFSSTVNRQVIIGFVLKAAASTCATIWASGQGLPADLTKDCYVDWQDLKVMVDYWLNTECSPPENCGGADFGPVDGIVNFLDFSDFADQWMQCNNPLDANCGI
jgi:O-glycosyl hydrolase